MLRGIRKASGNWIGKIVMATVMGFLILSFAIWGVADVFRGFGRSTVATIGATEIGVEQFRQIYNDRLQRIGRQLGKPLSGEQARALGFDRQVLQQLVAEATLDEDARRLGLGLDDATLGQMIRQDPVFRGPGGGFDPVRFAQMIRDAGFTEQRYLAEQRRNTLRQQIIGSIAGDLTSPRAMIDALIRVQSEQRDAAYLRLGPAQAGTIAEPTPEALAKFYEDNKTAFRAPEYRRIAYVAASPEDIAKWANISDEDARKAFAERSDRYTVPEKREVLQITFPNAEDAKAAKARIAGGTAFETIASERGLKAGDINLGTVTRAGIVDPAVAAAAFAISAGAVSEPIAGRFGTVLVKVAKIEPGVTPTFENVAAALKRDIAIERARSQVQDIYNKIEDERGGGASIVDAAKKLNLDAKIIEAVDRSGRAPDGKAVTDLPQGFDLLASAFASDVGVENDAASYRNGYLWYEVLGVTPGRDRSLDEVKDQVAQRWRDSEIAVRLKAKAEELVGKLKAGVSLEQIGTEIGVKVETAKGMTRLTQNAAMRPLIDAAFRTEKDGFGQTPSSIPAEWLVFKVTAVTVPAVNMDSDEAKALIEATRRAQSDELIAAYIGERERAIGVKINEQAFAIASGATSN